MPYDPEEKKLSTEVFLTAIEQALNSKGVAQLSAAMIQRVKLFRTGVLNPLAHAHAITLATPEVNEAIASVKALAFPDNQNLPTGTTFADGAHDRINKAPASVGELIEAACWLRTAFEFDLRQMLVRLHGMVKYRDNWNDMFLDELWGAAKAAMNAINVTSAAGLISDIEAHRQIFLAEWKYNLVSAITHPALQTAWAVLRDSSPGVTRTQTRLASFRR